jgi:hypothetical protein
MRCACVQVWHGRYAAAKAEHEKVFEDWRQNVSPEVLRLVNDRRRKKGVTALSKTYAGAPAKRPMGAFLRCVSFLPLRRRV